MTPTTRWPVSAKPLLAALALALALLPAWVAWTLAAPPEAVVYLGGEPIRAEVAATRARQVRGLSGRERLGPHRGMLFVYAEPGQHAFWMRGMKIPIDMIWIRNHRIVHIEHDVPPPLPGTPESELATYTSPEPANFVLEVAAGRARELGVEAGDRVRFDFNPS